MVSIDSFILNCSRLKIDQLKQLCNFDFKYKWKLLYRASLHGFRTSDFLKNCAVFSPTLTIVESTENFVFGGYATANWNSTGDWIMDKSAFIFSFINTANKSVKMDISDSKLALRSNFNNKDRRFNNGFSFGSDIVISDFSNINYHSRTNLGIHYKSHKNEETIYRYPTGNMFFKVKEIEVFKQIL